MEKIYQNSFTALSSQSAADHEVNGQQIIQVWTNVPVLRTQNERNRYFRESPQEHCLSVEFDVINGQNKVIFFFNDRYAGSVYPPRDTVPDDATLSTMLNRLVQLNG